LPCLFAGIALLRDAVLPAAIEQLPDLAGYLKFASHPAWLKIRLDLN
jgi:hypothetical protein